MNTEKSKSLKKIFADVVNQNINASTCIKNYSLMDLKLFCKKIKEEKQ